MNDTRVTPPSALAGAVYRKSSRSTSTSNCVEAADLPDGHRAVRDSKNPPGPDLQPGQVGQIDQLSCVR
jgi:hypothetical protein